MTMYEYYKDKYKITSYPLIDEQHFDALIAEIRAESDETIKKLERNCERWHKRAKELSGELMKFTTVSDTSADNNEIDC